MSATGGRSGHARVIAFLGVAQALTLAAGLVRWKVAAVLLGPAGVGIASVIDQLAQIAVKLGSLSLAGVALRFLALARADGDAAFDRLSRTFMRFTLIGTTLGATIALGVALLFPAVLGQAMSAYTLALVLGLAAVPWMGTAALLKNVMATLDRYRDAAVITLLGAVALVGATYVGIRVNGITGFYAGVLITSLAVFLVLRAGVRRHGPSSPGGAASGWREMVGSHRGIVRLSAAMYVVSVTSALVYGAMRFTVLRHFGEVPAGYLAAALAIAISIRVVLGEASVQYLIPAASRPTPPAERAAEVAVYVRSLAMLLLAAGLVAVLFPHEVLVALYASRFTAAVAYVGLFVLAESVAVVADTFRVLLVGLDDPAGYLTGMLSGHAVTIAGVLVLVPRYGIVAAALCHLAGSGVVLLACFWRLRTFHRIATEWRTGFVVAYCVVALAVADLVGLAAPDPRLSTWGWKLLFAIALGLGALPLLSPRDRASLMGLLRLRPRPAIESLPPEEVP